MAMPKVLNSVVRKIMKWMRIKAKPDYLPKIGCEVPTEVIQMFEWRLGRSVDSSQVVLFPSNGYRHYEHGEFDLYVLRKEGCLFFVARYSDGELEYN